ncbi:MAG TPA: ABC transporter ATP-binding protein [Polyangiaceae bacterium]|jgi:oligopeptide/dipeptide ABC transporter ATP-binding protein|nr:ABC transporter ATP-binding protein [Polyangiaceae bacterium]
MTDTLLDVTELSVHFPAVPLPVRAVDGVSFAIHRGETLALVGESGCGKSTIARAIMGLVPKTAGDIRFDGTSMPPLGEPARRPLLSRLQMIFQDPDASLNPRLTILSSVAEPVEITEPKVPRAEREARVLALMSDVGLDPTLAGRYPHELSGGQRQRVCIARALAVRPELLVCDEAVSALDVSIQAQILNLLVDLRERYNLSYLFITHDLRVVRHLATRVAVMYLGQIVELGPTDALFDAPRHPYTRALLAAVPSLTKAKVAAAARARGEIPSPSNPPSGCRFHTRCPEVFDRCPREEPAFFVLPEARRCRCFLVESERTTAAEP